VDEKDGVFELSRSSGGSLQTWYLGLLASASTAWAITGIIESNVGLVVLGSALALIFAGTAYITTSRSIDRRDYRRIASIVTRRR
jgi:hypothetical protein